MPVAVAGGLSFESISAGAGDSTGVHTCGVTSSGAAYCWGNNAFGELGDGTTINRVTPVAVRGNLAFPNAAAVRARVPGVFPLRVPARVLSPSALRVPGTR
jgi:alpha-tubulin suppressor-like RCC1 family protein